MDDVAFKPQSARAIIPVIRGRQLSSAPQYHLGQPDQRGGQSVFAPPYRMNVKSSAYPDLVFETVCPTFSSFKAPGQPEKIAFNHQGFQLSARLGRHRAGIRNRLAHHSGKTARAYDLDFHRFPHNFNSPSSAVRQPAPSPPGAGVGCGEGGRGPLEPPLGATPTPSHPWRTARASRLSRP